MDTQPYHPALRSINIATYPDENPFDADPPIHNLTPQSFAREWANDTPELRAAALAAAEGSGLNPLRFTYGQDPFIISFLNLGNPYLFTGTAYAPPPPLPEVALPEDAVFVQQIHEHCKTVLITVRIGDDTRLLKIVRAFVPILSQILK